jgi:hypothetical protein
VKREHAAVPVSSSWSETAATKARSTHAIQDISLF